MLGEDREVSDVEILRKSSELLLAHKASELHGGMQVHLTRCVSL